MLQRFYPDEYMHSTYEIDFEKLHKQGFRGIIFDIDNTLVPHGEKADKRAIDFFHKLKEMGFECCLMSNNKQQRVEMFHQDVQVNYIFDAKKPSRKNYIKAMKIMGTNLNNTVFVGDQLFTDVFGAKRTGIKAILVKPIHPKEEIQIVLKRNLEKIVLYFYQKRKR
ncbi:YqeG family HAD IIIA-type phosphatase [Anaerosacchariphilus polymeriproducens]|uniref:YqeG family HAD IIIA-type phosphatase n=1 Tax=Anaerosacchariphilus polymeriproducens TaxID=1812858 RepID=A0A371AXJ5_9FIRM|nr:YqeG family HAD IIIA-type phosphatase [Anaerosacchariphilus polymeriproducens]RDU24305.1 YqeG family HAD IIIA-type phosphatase [Anaerosacchariphilus polymeriproducens]